MGVDIEVVQDVTDELVQAFARLLPQLSQSARALDAEALKALVTLARQPAAGGAR